MADDRKSGTPKSGGSTFEKDIDDWAMALEEWDANLPIQAPPPEEKPKPRERTATPVVGVPLLRPEGELEAPPPPAAPPSREDPLMHLFEGELDLPEDAGQALGSLLGDQVTQPPLETTLEAEPPPLYADADFGGETRVAGAAEFERLLADAESFEEAEALPPPPAQPLPSMGAPRPPISMPPSLAEPVPLPPAKAPEWRVVPPPPAEPKPVEAAAPEPIDDLDVELEIGPAIEQAVAGDDFYDDLVVEQSREVPESALSPSPSPPPSPLVVLRQDAPADEDDLFDLPLTVDASRRSSDPDRTPLPVPDDELYDDGATVIPSDLDVPESRPLVAARIETPPVEDATASGPKPSLPETAEPVTLPASYWRDQLALLDTERLLTEDKGRLAQLAFAAGRVAERLGDVGAAIERYGIALEANPKHAHALRGLRRLRLADGKREPVLAMLDRELEQASAAEKGGLHAIRAELALALGDRALAGASYQAILAETPNDLGALLGLSDLAAQTGDEDRAAALGALVDALGSSSDNATRAALIVERARLDEAAGRVREAVARFKEALDVDPTAAPAAWGLLRVAVRTPGITNDLETHLRLCDLLPEGKLRRAIERRLGVLRARGGDVAAARPALQAAAAEGDRVALADLAALEKSDGRAEEALQALARVIDGEPDAGRRADALVMLGELAEAQGRVGEAAAAYTRAASEYPEDPRAARALERTQAAGGDKESALARHLQAASRSPARAAMELTYAARLLRELGRGDEALARLAAALSVQPTLAPAIDLGIELHLAGGHVDDAAELLTRAADAADDVALKESLRTRAARLLLLADRPAEASVALRPVVAGEGSGVRPLRWLEQRILRRLPGEGEALRRSLSAEADATESSDARRLAAIAYELASLGPADDDATLATWRRALLLQPEAAAVVLELVTRPGGDERFAELPACYKERLGSVAARPEEAALKLRLGTALLEDAREGGAAARVFAEIVDAVPGFAPACQGIERVARAAADTPAELEALDWERKDTELPEQRFAIEMLLGERLERANQHDKAVEHYRAAYELRPGHPVAREALERALMTTRNYSTLADLALHDLKDAPDPRSKVAAYERLAFVDGELRGDAQSALLGFASIIEVDHAHHGAMRVLERSYLGDARWPELVALYEQMGLGASDPAFAVAVHLERARLRRRMLRPEARAEGASEAETVLAIDNDHRLALFKDRHCRPALRHAYARARAARDLLQEADTASALAEAESQDARTAAVMLTRAAESYVELAGPVTPDGVFHGSVGAADEARARYHAAIERIPSHVPALVGYLHLALVRGEIAVAARIAERAGHALADAAGKARLLLIAGAIVQDKIAGAEGLTDEDLKNAQARAQLLFSQALVAEPRSREAFSRLERLLVERKDHGALAELYQRRLGVETDGDRLMALHLRLARLCISELGDRERARTELKSVLMQDPTHSEALAVLADLQFEDQQWAEAADTLIRRARAERDRSVLRDVFFKLGIIYSEHLPDAKRAIASFARVLQVTPDDLTALEHLSNVQMREWDWKGALSTTQRLADIEPDVKKKVAHLHRIAKIYEEGFKDARHALDAFRAAIDLDPLYMVAVGEMARFFDRQSDVQSMRVLLDRSAARVRQQLDTSPHDPTPYRSLFRIFNWRRAPDRAAFAAGILDWLGAAEPDEKAMLARISGREGYPGPSLADPTIDELLFDARVPAGFRNLFRLLDEPLGKMFRADIKRLGVTRTEKLPRSGHPVREVANRIAADLGVKDFDLYITAAHPTALVVELTDPLSVVLGAKIVDNASVEELRFLFGRSFKMIQSHMALPMRLLPEDLGLLVGGIVRQFVPDFVPAGFPEPQIIAEAGRIARVIPKKMHGELLPFALECASQSLDLKLIAPSLVHTANRAGLLACGLPGAALAALSRLNDEAQLRALLRFLVSDELAEIRRALGAAIG